MRQRDFQHNATVRALEKAGWTITDDPLHLGYGDRNLYVDLGAENFLAAEKDHRLIAVEVKGFGGACRITAAGGAQLKPKRRHRPL